MGSGAGVLREPIASHTRSRPPPLPTTGPATAVARVLPHHIVNWAAFLADVRVLRGFGAGETGADYSMGTTLAVVGRESAGSSTYAKENTK